MDDDQDLSVDALVAVVEQALGSKQAIPKSSQLSIEPLHPSLDSKEGAMDLDLLKTSEQPFIMPIKKKRMQPPVGKRTKSTKSKRRS